MPQSISICAFRFLLYVCTIIPLAACDATKPVAAPALPQQDAAWSRIISAHSSGMISRKSAIRVVFANDVASAEQVGQSAEAHLKTDPAVIGKVSFINRREIVLTPDTDLMQGQSYRVMLNTIGLLNAVEKLKVYEFTVQVQQQQFEVNVEGLASGPAGDAEMLLKGSVVTADVDVAERVEKLLGASYLDKPLAVSWHHNVDARHHDFSVSGIARQQAATPLLLKWNGASIGVDSQGERIVEIPPLGQFKVTQATVEEAEGQQFARIFFSDKLDARQNLRGLVRLGNDLPTTQRIEGNLLNIYPDRGVQGDLTVTLEPGIRNAKGGRTAQQSQHSVSFASTKPQVRFVGKGVILPDSKVLSVPFEAVNVRSVRVTAMRIYDNNVGQFLQTNKLDGTAELARVGRFLWRKTVPLSSPDANKWQRHHLDVTELFQKHPGGLFRLTLSIGKADSVYPCSGDTAERNEIEAPPLSAEDFAEREVSSWDYAEEYYGADGEGGEDGEGANTQRNRWQDRDNPCKNAYYRKQVASYYDGGSNKTQYSIRDERNFLASNIGMLAKRDPQGKLLVVTTDLKTAAPLKGVKISAMNFQNQLVSTEATDGNGMANFKPGSAPFYLLAEKDGQKGYLKVAQGAALPVSHFDIGGEKISAGIKGHLYGERGVWRPGDDIFLTFVLQDKDKSLPANHPVTLELRNPQGQLAQTLTNAAPVGGFYKFVLKTDAAAPTGNWSAKAILGGTSFSKTLKIETVMPNRLKLEVALGDKTGKKLGGGEPLRGKLVAQWLTGASAAGLKADVQLRLNKTPTQFDRYADFIFDDPAREFSAEPETVFEGELNDAGQAPFEHPVNLEKQAPGMLSAALTSRVFERGGAFSINRQTLPYSPYSRYIGIKLPKGDVARNMLLTDKPHTVEIASLSADGKPASIKNVQITLYKVDWKWWWDKSGDTLAQYASASHQSKISQATLATANGKGSWKFEIMYPQWGRYLVRACDLEGGHCTGNTFYIDWPAWAGRAQEQAGPGASMLNFQSDKQQYSVGDKAVIQLPDASQGRALVTVENGTGIIDARWIEFARSKDDKDSKEKKSSRARFELPITRAMTPNVYVSVTLIQPHENRKNDLPIRLYGVIPIHVTDPGTQLKPQLHTADEWVPEGKASVEIAEANGREMTYSVAVVDEGLLGLTNFKTPDLHAHFYQREALGITTWDLFDEVAGAYAAKLDRLLALGGSDAGDAKEAKQDKKRFPPVVSYLGPFKLAARAKNKHEIQLPAYVGAVRAMVVAGDAGATGNAYGSTEKSIYVRQPLMLLPTLPRVIGPEEEFTVPVSLFVMDPSIKEVTLKLEPDQQFQLVGKNSVTLSFAKPEEKLGLLKLKSAARLGKGQIKFVATSGKHSARAEVFLEVRSPNPATTRHQRKALVAGETWEATVLPHGLPGTNLVTVEMSSVPPLDLERHLHYLIRYPHGCIEQLTSAAFPQLYLPALLKLEDARKKEIEENVHAAIKRLRGYQLPNGSFGYWPGGFVTHFDGRDAWSTNYAGHFMVEAGKLGYQVPPNMLADWTRFQKSAAQAWTAGGQTSTLDQAYRLYTLAVANQAEVGAMNRLRETANLPSTARWMLAAAYKLAGMADAAASLVKGDTMKLADYAQPDATFGSRLRDAAIVLNSLVILNQLDAAKPLVDEISAQLASDLWHSTQSLSYSLMAMAKFVGNGKINDYRFERSIGGSTEKFQVNAPIHTATLKGFPDAGGKIKLKNTSERNLFATILSRGIAKAGEDEAASAGLSLEAVYRNDEGQVVDVAQLVQGQDLVAEITVKNLTALKLDNLALTQMVAAGYEIHNERMEGAEGAGRRDPKQKKAHGGFFVPDGSPAATRANLEHLDVRDDRVLRYFSLQPGESVRYTTRLNAAYLGRFYQPGLLVEAMYDATKNARTKGKWVEVVAPGK